MKKIYYWSILILMLMAFLPQRADAQNNTQRETHVTPTQALNVGYTFMRTGDGSKGNGTKSGNMSKQTMQLVYTGQTTDSLTGTTTDCYYVFALQPKGFVIVAADERVEPILGYSYDNNFVVENMPNHVRGWLGNYERQIEAVTKSDLQTDLAIQTKWTRLKNGQAMSTKSSGDTTVGPLLTTTWDQGQYYNALCPADAAGPDGHALTGCVATAMAQIINYWGYPVHGRGIHSYESNYGTLMVNYDSANYDYTNMPSALTNTSTAAEVNAVATLMRDCGVAANMGYGASESSTYDVDARAGMINFFRLSSNLSYAEKSFFADSVWEDMLRADIDANRPVMYSGFGTGGHTFVCDGYQQDSYFHFNFGWGGFADGWYLTCTMTPGGMDFNSDQSAIFGIVPDSTGNVILGQMTGNSRFSVNEPLEFYHLMGHNGYLGEDLLFQNDGVNDVIFYSSDTNKHLKIELLNYVDQQIRIDKGDRIEYWTNLHIFNSNNGSYLEAPIVSPANIIICRYWTEGKYEGFKIRISEEDSCYMITNVSSIVDTDNVTLTWTENGNAGQWNIEYGTKGFAKGTGILTTVDTTTVTIEGLENHVDYDFYIRPTCHDAWFGPYSAKTNLSYWQAIVTTEPNECTWDSAGRAIVSTVEQLVWFLRDNGTDNIYITEDLDLSGHRWKPVSNFSGNIDGGGHSISNLIIYEEDYQMNGGMLKSLNHQQNINNILFINSQLSLANVFSCGVLAGSVSNGATLKNCGIVGGEMQCSSINLGGLVGCLDNGFITNSFSNITINNRYNQYSSSTTGGLVGTNMRNGNLLNCYSASNINFENPGWTGLIVGYNDDGKIEKLYGKNANINMVGYYSGAAGYIRDTARFNISGQLLTGITFDDSIYYELLDVLNMAVQSMNDCSWYSWTVDNTNINDGYPLHDDYYVVLCPNVSNLTAQNIEHNNQIVVRLEWDNPNRISSFVVRCQNHNDTLPPYYLNSDSNVCFLDNLVIGNEYEISVRAKCDDNTSSGWGNSITHIYDLPYWTSIVTEQPEGYFVDNNGNVTISSAEGFAWLASCVNGLNNQEGYSFQGKTIYITSDIDLGQYRWMPVGNQDNVFSGSVVGKQHIIKNIHINENCDCVGLFGYLKEAKITNITIMNGQIKGRSKVGGICGEYNTSWERVNENYGNNVMDQCHIVETTVSGTYNIGGLCGYMSPIIGDLSICNCSTSGIVSGVQFIGGIIGNLVQNSLKLNNCFSSANISIDLSNIIATSYDGLSGGLIGYMGGLVGSAYALQSNNCYYASHLANIEESYSLSGFWGVLFGTLQASSIKNVYGLYDEYKPLVGFFSDGGFWANNSYFIKDNKQNIILEPIAIEGLSYSELLSALNAWVDAYDTAGIYRHWAADTAMVNGGFPVFAAIPCTEIDVHDTIVVCDSYTWHGMVFTADTLLTDTLSTFVGCDSVVTHHIIINHPVHTNVTEAACESYEWNGETYTISGDYDQTFTAVNGCDSIVTLHLIVNYSTSGDTTAVTCDSFDWYEQINLTQSGDYTRIITNVNGCDSLVTLHLTINPTYNVTDSKTICASQLPYDWNGVTFNATGTQSATLPTVNGCDSVVTMTLYVNPTYNVTDSKTICASQLPYEWNGVEFTATGTQSATLSTVNGCDSVVTMTLTVNPTYNVTDTNTICQSQLPYTWNGVTFTAAGTQSATLPTVNGCDSVVTMTLTVNPTYNVTDSKTICQSQLPYTWNGVTFNAAGTQSATLPTLNDCDSVVTMTLTVNSTYNVTDSKTICQSQLPYTWNDVTFNAAGTQSATLPTLNGCDSVVTMTLTVNPTYNVTDTKTICQSQLPYEWNGVTFTAAGTQSATLPTVNGCDSVVTMTLIVNPTYNVTDSKTICQSQLPYTWNGVTFTAAGTQSATLPTVNGCDSVVTMTLTVNPTYNVTDTKTICQSQLPYTWNGVTFNAAGTQSATLPTLNGCDSVVTMTLTVNPTYNVTDSKTICQSQLPYTWNGVTFNAAGTQSATLPTVNGCDSVVTMTLTVNPTYTVTDIKTICQSQLPYEWNGVIFNAAGTQSATLSTVNGCDSVVTMTLTVNPTYNVTDTKTICQSQLPYEWNGVIFNAAGTQSATLSTVNGCDSVVTMTLIVNLTYSVTDTKTICQSQLPYEWNGVIFNAAGTQSTTLQTVNGCDSVVTMTLTVNPTYSVTDTKTICQSQLPYEWNGVTFNTPGTQSATLQTVNGCDSVVVMTLIVNPTYNVTDSKIICQSQLPYTWNGVTFNAAGTQTATLPTVNGCDSVVVMTLIVNQPTTGTDVQVACGSYTWIDGVTYTESNNTATYMLTNAAGCDSVVTLNLTISQPTTGIDVQTVCGSYTWIDGITYTESNSTATYMLTNAVGCDSIVTLNLTINQPTTGTDMQTACDSFTWIDGVTYTESNSTATYTLTNAAGCDSVVTLNLTLNHAETAEIAETACGSFEWNGVTFTTSGDYTQTFTNAAGCDSVVTLHLTVSPIEESDFSITTEDSCYTWNGQDYCTSGDYTQTLQTIHGCDSVVTMHLTITVGVNDYDAFDFKVYPNPTTGVVNVQITNHNSPITEFHVYDAYGKLIRLLNVQATQIDLSGLANGIYFVKAVAEGNVVAIRKVVKN